MPIIGLTKYRFINPLPAANTPHQEVLAKIAEAVGQEVGTFTSFSSAADSLRILWPTVGQEIQVPALMVEEVIGS